MDFQKQQRPLLDLNDYLHKLVRHPKHRGAFECPLCTVGKFTFSSSKATDFTCWTNGCDRGEICKVLTRGENTFLSDEQKARNEAAAHAQVEKERARKEALKSSEQKNTEFLATLSQRTLSNSHRQDMLDRGYTPEQIEASGAKSFAAGRGMPVRDYTGKVVGIQRAGKGEKFWLGGDAGNYKLKETDELPLSIVYPATLRKPVKGVAIIGLVEGTGDKPFLAAHQLERPMIGSSNIGSQPKDLARSIAGIKAKYGWKKIELVLYPDAGMLANKGVMGRYAELCKQAADMGYEMKVCWWNQYLKADGDIDEFALTKENNKTIEFDKFLKIAEHRKSFLELSSLDLKNPALASVAEINQRYVPSLDLKPGTIHLVSSACGTGKTTMMLDVIKKHLEKNPKGRVIDITHLEAIRIKHNRDLGFDDWKVGENLNLAALNSYRCVSVCLNSLLSIDKMEIPQGSLLNLDEVEAQLEFLARGGNLKGPNLIKIQRHLVDLIQHVLYGGGIVVAGEDDLTDISVNCLSWLTKGKYPIELVLNHYQGAAPEKTTMYEANPSQYAARLDELVAAGKKVFCPSSAQKHLEAQHMILEAKYNLENSIVRIARKTNGVYTEFLENPEAYLLSHTIQVLFASPKMQSGVSIDKPGLFDCKLAWFSCFGVRKHWQLLNRDREQSPTEIFIKRRGADADGAALNLARYEKLTKAIASEACMKHGYGLHQSAEGNIWNAAEAVFKVRDSISSNYAYEYLRLELIARGHSIEQGLCSTDEDFKEKIAAANEAILDKECKDLEAADTKGMTQQKADAIKNSPDAVWDLQVLAEKFTIEQHYPGLPMEYDYIRKLTKENQGRYGKAIDRRFSCLNPALAKSLDKEIIDALRNETHLMHRQVPKNSLQADLMQPILGDLINLAESGLEFDNSTPVVRSIAAYAVKRSSDFSKFYRFVVKAETTGEKGQKSNSCVATVNKLLRVIGYESKRTSQRREGKERIGCYSVINADCLIAKAAMESLNRRFAKYEPKVIEQEFKPGMPVISNGELAEVISAEECGGHGGIRTMYVVRTESGDETYQRKELLRRA
jgi:hypothetical protein